MVDFLMAGLFTWLAARAVDLLRDLSSWLTWLFTSPDVTVLPQVQTIASRATMVVNTCYIVAIIVAGIIVMVSSSVQVRYTVKDFIPRLIVAFGLSNFALPMCSALIELANAVTVTMVDESAPTSQATTMVLAHLLAASTDPNSGFVVVIIGWLIVVLLYSLTVTWIVRVATLVIVAGIGPAAMACYCLPYTQPAAALWWRSLLGCLGRGHVAGDRVHHRHGVDHRPDGESAGPARPARNGFHQPAAHRSAAVGDGEDPQDDAPLRHPHQLEQPGRDRSANRAHPGRHPQPALRSGSAHRGPCSHRRRQMTTHDTPRAAVPADVGAPDTIAFGLTFRQLAIVGSVGLVGWLVHSGLGPLLPPVVWVVLAVPVAAVTVVVALGRRDGLPLDVWLRHAVTFTRSARTFTPGRPRGSGVVAVAGKPMLPAPLRLPASAISPTGVVEVDGGRRFLVACGTTNLHLRTGEEQAAMLDGFGRLLNALTGPAQFVVSAHRFDLAPYADAVSDIAPGLGHSALTTAAADYAAFLLELDATREPLRRQVTAVFSNETDTHSAVRALSALGVTTTVLDGGAVTVALATAVDPYTPPVPGPRAVPGAPITFRRIT